MASNITAIMKFEITSTSRVTVTVILTTAVFPDFCGEIIK